jgi:excisionase family DNA binding protein
MAKLLLSPTEAAKELGVSRSRFYELLGVGAIPYVLVMGQRKIRAEDVQAYVASLEPQRATEPTEKFQRLFRGAVAARGLR